MENVSNRQLLCNVNVMHTHANTCQRVGITVMNIFIYIPYILRSDIVAMAAQLISSRIPGLRPNQRSEQF